ncbi:MAG TPA: ABC transporter ATP-binding protein [Bacillota bacterium]
MLEVKDIHVYYGRVHALKGVSLEVGRGELVVVVGANGAGKTTLLRTVCGLLHPRSGRVSLDGADVSGLPPQTIVRRGIAASPDNRQVFPRMTVLENLEMGAFSRPDRTEIRRDLERVCTVFPALRDRRRQVAGTLSGGEQQMLAIARAMMASPRLLLMDEPSMGLAPRLVAAMFETIRRIRDDGTGILLVEQNARLALDIADRAYVLETGRVLLSGTGRQLSTDPMVRQACLGGA